MLNWYENENYWRKVYPILFSPAMFAAAENELMALLEMSEYMGGRILDLGCGPGRYSIAAAQLGIPVTAVDTSRFLLAQGRRCIGAEKIEWLCRDMRLFSRPQSFAGVFLMYTSFGYFTEAENLLVLRRAYNNLENEGCLLIDLAPKEYFVQHPEPTFFPGSINSQACAEWQPWSNCVRQTWTIGSHRFVFSHRAYSSVELAHLLKQVGFQKVETYADTSGRYFDIKNPSRLICLARKKAPSTF